MFSKKTHVVKCSLPISLVQIRESVGTFIRTVIEKLDTSEHKLPQLLFVLYASFKYGISLPSASIAKAEKLFEDIGFLQEEELRGKR